MWVNAGPVESVFLPLALLLPGLAPVTLITDGNQEFLQEETEHCFTFEIIVTAHSVNMVHANYNSEILR